LQLSTGKNHNLTRASSSQHHGWRSCILVMTVNRFPIIPYTAPIPTNDIMVLPGIYYTLGRTIILLMDLKRTISLLESWHGGNLTDDFLFLQQAQEERSSVQKLFNHFMFAEHIPVRISRISSCCINLDGRLTHVQRGPYPPLSRQPARWDLYSEPTDYAGTKSSSPYSCIVRSR
jgi:hypothetical protein